MENKNVLTGILPGGLSTLEMMEEDLEFASNRDKKVSSDDYDINYLSSLDKDDLNIYLRRNPELLINNDVQNLIMEERNHYAFVWLTDYLRTDIFKYFPASELIKHVLKDSRCIDKINVILGLGNVSEFLSVDILKIIFENNDLLFCLGSIDESSSNIIFDYMLKNSKCECFGYLPEVYQEKLLRTNLFKILASNLDKRFFYKLNGEILNFLFSFDKIQEFILNSDIEFVNRIIKDDVVIPFTIYNDKRFKNFYLNILDPIKYRFYIMNLEKNNDFAASLIDELRVKRYDKIYEDYTEDANDEKIDDIYYKKDNGEYFGDLVTDVAFVNICNVFDDEKIFAVIKKEDDIYMKDVIIDRFFGDVSVNFLKNLEVMMNFIKASSKEIIPKERVNIYNKFLNFDNLSITERRELYFEMLKKGSWVQIFYDDYKMCQEKSYSDLKNSIIDLEKCEKQKHSVFTDMVDAPVYYFNGEKFAFFGHNTSSSRQKQFIWGENFSLEGLSLSYITDKNIDTFNNPYESIVLGFSDVDIKRILHLRNTDSFSKYSSVLKDYSTFVKNIYTPEKLVEETISYNEILYQNINKKIPEITEKLRPSYVVCYDEIQRGDILTAKALNIPIVLINTKVYGHAKGGVDTDDKKKYVTDTFSAHRSRVN